MRANLRWLIWAPVPLLVLLSVGCKDDDNNGPGTTGTLTGQVVFHGEWPDSGTVQLSIFENWSTIPCSWCGVAPGGPPSYFTGASYFHDPDTTNAGPDTIPFTISGITLGTYSAAAVGWRAPVTGNINCTEPVIGLYGARWQTSDSIPEAVTFSESQPTLNVTIDADFDILPIPHCFEGTITGTARIDGDWPAGGLLVMLTTFPVTAWMPLTGQPSGYFLMPAASDSNFTFVVEYGSYYLSIWTLGQPPNVQWYGSYLLDTQIRPGNLSGSDARPDVVTISAADTAASGLIVEGFAPAPHWISGSIDFNIAWPETGLLILMSSEPVSPEQPPTQPPWGYYLLPDSNETLYALTGMAEGTYYVSLWNNAQGPAAVCYGAYGYVAGIDPIPDPIVISTTPWGYSDIDITVGP